MSSKLTIFLILVAMLGCTATSARRVIRLIVGYCPTDFTGAAAVVDVDPVTANWTIKAHVVLPSEVFGCVADYDPTFDFVQHDENTVWLDFVSDDGFFLAIDTRFGNTSRVSSSSWTFTGFINFKAFPSDGQLHGVAGDVTESGYCSDGCLSWGVQHVTPGDHKYETLSLIPFKAGADDTSFANWADDTFLFQGSYDLRDVTCGPQSSSQCLITLNASTGHLLRAVHTPNYQVFKFARSGSSPTQTGEGGLNVLAFAQGSACGGQNATWGYEFVTINTISANASLVSCVDPNLVLQEDEWVASFSPDGSILATGSGNGDGDDPQLVVLDVKSGDIAVSTTLTGLAKALKAKMGLVFIWALEVV